MLKKVTLLSAICGAAVLLSSAGCQSAAPRSGPGASGPEIPPGSTQVVLWVKGLSCPLCAHGIDVQLLRVPGVTAVRVDLGTGRVEVGLSPDTTPTSDDLAAAIRASGFTLARIDPTSTARPVTTCAACICEECRCASSSFACVTSCACGA